MKERVFIKKNIFTSVMFGAVFLFVLFESIFYRDNLYLTYDSTSTSVTAHRIIPSS